MKPIRRGKIVAVTEAPGGFEGDGGERAAAAAEVAARATVRMEAAASTVVASRWCEGWLGQLRREHR